MQRKPFWRSKTLWFNGLIAGALVAWQSGSGDLSSTLNSAFESLSTSAGDSVPAVILVAVAVVNMMLRFVTSEPISMQDGKALWRSKTLWTNGLMAVGLVGEKFGYGNFSSVLDSVGKHGESGVPVVALLVVLVANIFLRIVTKSSARRLI